MSDCEDLKSHYLFPGTLFAPADPHRVTTVLGSCIAVCLFDPRRSVGGMNHFLLPFWNGEGLPTPRYGNVAIRQLIEKLERLGSRREHLQAKLFGGASMWEPARGLMGVGERNIDLAREMLDAARIPIVKSDVGGRAGRKIVFHTATGEVLLKRHRER